MSHFELMFIFVTLLGFKTFISQALLMEAQAVGVAFSGDIVLSILILLVACYL